MASTTPPTPSTGPDLHGRTVWVIDTLSRIYQLFHALPEMTSPQGTPVAAIFGFTRDLLDVIEKKKADYLFCAMDAPGPTFRHERFAGYKATRSPMPTDLVPQIPLMRRLLDCMGIPCVEMAGFEADDILATFASRTLAQGGQCILATSDKDARQLLCDRVRLLNLRSNAFMGTPELLADWGIRPDQVVDYLSLVGDAADNVPGVPLIGPKIASELLRTHDTLDHVLAHTDVVAGTKRRENLRTYADTARSSRELVRLDREVPIDIPWEAGRIHTPDAEKLAAFLHEMGFQSLQSKVRSAPARKPRSSESLSRSKSQQGMLNLEGDHRDGKEVIGKAVEDQADTREDRSIAVRVPLKQGPREPTALPSDWERPTDDAALAALVLRLPSPSSIVLCVAQQPGGTILSPPVGIALASEACCAWIGNELLYGFDEGSVPEGLRSLAHLLSDKSVPKMGHDLKRQAVALHAIGIRLGGWAFDTLLAAYLLDAGERNHGLAEIAERSGVATFEGSRVQITADDATLIEHPSDAAHAAESCRVVQSVFIKLSEGLHAAHLHLLYADVELPLAGVLADMEFRGLRIDCNVLASLSARYAAQLASLEQDIHAMAGHSFAISSPLQVRGVLFDELNLPVVKRTKTGPSTDAEVLEELARLHPLPAKLLEHRRYAKLKSTYVDALPALVEPSTGRIHTTFNQTVTATGRLSSSDPNLQNIPTRTAEGQHIRAAFLPRETGWRFVAADYSQIELRILAHLSHDQAMRIAFETNEDIHTRTAVAVFGVAPEAVTSDLRRIAKAVNFGILYGQSAFGLAKTLGISQAEAAAFIAAYFQTFSGAAAFMDDVLDGCRRDGYVTTILGRRRTITGVRDHEGRRSVHGSVALSLPERTAINTVVQGSAADLIKLAMLHVASRLQTAGMTAAIVLQIHDELVVECPAEEVMAVGELVGEEMRAAMSLDVPLDVSVHSGSTWAECEKG
jgi:DNA polymerase-1